MNDIFLSLEKHYNEIIKRFDFKSCQLVGVFLYGSQNYGIATEASDVDSVAIILPSKEELYFKQPLTQEIHMANGEHCVVKDIREVFNMFKKQNINFLEILFTKFYKLNPIYERQWKYFSKTYRELIARYDMHIGINSIKGQSLHTLRQAKTTLDDTIRNKKYANLLRMKYYIKQYINTQILYADCIYLPDGVRDYVLAVKNGQIILSEEEIISLEDFFNSLSTQILEDEYKPLIMNSEKQLIDKVLKESAMMFIDSCLSAEAELDKSYLN